MEESIQPFSGTRCGELPPRHLSHCGNGGSSSDIHQYGVCVCPEEIDNPDDEHENLRVAGGPEVCVSVERGLPVYTSGISYGRGMRIMERRILIEIEEPDFMNLVNPDEKKELNSKVAEAIKSRVFDLFASEMKKIVKERYNLSPQIRRTCSTKEF
jgi:hypothetical protein